MTKEQKIKRFLKENGAYEPYLKNCCFNSAYYMLCSGSCLRNAALKNGGNKIKGLKLFWEHEPFTTLIDRAMSWAHTPQRHYFWEYLHDELKKYNYNGNSYFLERKEDKTNS